MSEEIKITTIVCLTVVACSALFSSCAKKIGESPTVINQYDRQTKKQPQ